MQGGFLDIVGESDMSREPQFDEFGLVVVVEKHQIFIKSLGSGDRWVPHRFQQGPPLTLWVGQFTVDTRLDQREDVIVELDPLSIDLIISQQKGKLQSHHLVYLVVQRSGLQIDSVTQGTQIGLQR